MIFVVSAPGRDSLESLRGRMGASRLALASTRLKIRSMPVMDLSGIDWTDFLPDVFSGGPMTANLILAFFAVLLPLCLIFLSVRKALGSAAGRTLKIGNLVVGVLLFVLMPSIECIGRVVAEDRGEDGDWGEAQVLRIYAFGHDPGFINPPVLFPLFPNSDLFSNAFAFLGALLLGISLVYLPNTKLTIAMLMGGFLLLQVSLAIVRFYIPYYDPTVILDLPLLPVLCGYVAGRWPASKIPAFTADLRRG
jgi:hypothetical protein